MVPDRTDVKMMKILLIHCFCFVVLNDVRQIKSCPDNCQFCDTDGYCLSCIDVYAGRNCDHYCSNCHPKTRCDKLTYFCIERCRDGLSGNLCNEDCHERCLSCNRTDPNVCLTCVKGSYGAECVKCPVSCINQTCDQQGFCTLGCKPGAWGQMCEKICSEHCIDNACLRENGTCEEECEDGSTGSNCKEPNNEAILSPVVVAIIIVLSVITLAAVTVIIVYRLRRRILSRLTERRNVESTKPSGEDVPLNQTGLLECNVDQEMVHFKNAETRKEAATEVHGSRNDEPENKNTEIEIQQFENYVRGKSTDIYKKELNQLDGSVKGKKLQERKSGVLDTNWTIVQGYMENKSYATCKVGTDWKDVWKQVLHIRSDIIILFIPPKYNNMLPKKNERFEYGDVVVSCSDEARNDTYLIARKCTLQEQVEERPMEKYVVTFLQYLVLPDDSTEEEDKQNLSGFQKIVRDTKSKRAGPYFVLCNNECDGYAGTFIALDMLVDKAEHTGSVDVYACVKKLRDDMVSVAKTTSQYELLHKALAISLAQKEMKAFGPNERQKKSDTVTVSSEKSRVPEKNLL